MCLSGVLSRPWAKNPARLIVALAVVSAVPAVTVGASASGATKAAAPHQGGSLTVLEGAALVGGYPEGLDPGQNSLTTSGPMMDAIYGDLFQLGPKGKVVPDLATGYKLSKDAKTLTLHLRQGVQFSDGTPFNAAAVVASFKRYLAAAKPNNPQWPATTSITAPDPYTVVVNFSQPDGAAVVQMFDTSVSWIASPTALAKLGPKEFLLKPVGAGPFTVVSDTLSTKLVLKKNPKYWQKGHPYLDNLTFTSVASDQSALEALQAKDAQAYQGMGSPSLVDTYKAAGLTLTEDPGIGVIDLMLNDQIAPLNNIKARQAIYYALDAAAISKNLFKNTCTITQSFTGPGGAYYNPKVPNYRTYDLAKAKALVQQLGGLTFTMNYLASGLAPEEATAIGPMFKAAGMNVTLNPWASLTSAITGFNTHKWQVNLWVTGAYDPAGGAALNFFLYSKGPFTGTHDAKVDSYITAGGASSNPKVRAVAYKNLANRLNQQALQPYICAPASWDVAAKGVTAPGLTTAFGGYVGGPMVQWQNASVGNE
jgi:ABC-type transport system substrate-binding protein